MIIRCAFFRGRIKPGREAEFEGMLETVLVPLWRQFPSVQEVRLLRRADADAQAPDIHLVLATRYPDLATMEAALSSPAREATRGPTRDLLGLFDGEVFHVTFDTTDYVRREG
jgi:antibiotic biosynthesis monooxygenase (ABM) superfamily enzyme